MKFFFVQFSVLFFISISSLSTNAQPTMLVAGDSWAWLPCLMGSFQTAFLHEKIHANVAACTKTSGMHIRAENWLDRKEHNQMMKMLSSRKDITVVYLSLGGNDFLTHWRVDMTSEQEANLINDIRDKVEKIVATITTARPDVKVLVSGYDFSRIYSEHKNISNYDKMYERSGRPSISQMHHSFDHFTKAMSKIGDGNQVAFIHHVGLMQYHFGNSETGLSPHLTLPPEQISPPNAPDMTGGDPDKELDKKAMARIGKIVDSYHLTPKGYVLLVRHSIQHYLRDWLK